MSGEFDPEQQPDPLKEEVEQFEAMLRRNEEKFYDVDSIEEIAEYYLMRGELTWAERAIGLGLSQHPYSTELK